MVRIGKMPIGKGRKLEGLAYIALRILKQSIAHETYYITLHKSHGLGEPLRPPQSTTN